MQAPNASSQSEQQDNDVDADFLVQTHKAISLIDQTKSLRAIIMKNVMMKPFYKRHYYS